MKKKSFEFRVSSFKPSFEFQVPSFKFWFLNLKPETRNQKPLQALWFVNLKPIQAGFTLIELIIVISLVGVLGVVAAERLLFYQELAEKAAMQAVLAATKMGLQIRMAELIIANNKSQAVDLENENPMRWLDEKPLNYAADYRSPAKPGYWYFAADARQLVYVPNSTRHLIGGQADAKALRFQVKLRYDEIDTGAGKAKTLSGIGLVPVQPYQWF